MNLHPARYKKSTNLCKCRKVGNFAGRLALTAAQSMEFSRYIPFAINIRGRLHHFDRPQVMGIVNATPDSFHAPSRAQDADAVARTVAGMVAQGVDWLDVGACSTRPGSTPPTVEQEIERLGMALDAIRREAGNLPVSVDTYRSEVARIAVTELGADIVNDISAGNLDVDMIATVAECGVPYIAMHMRGTPDTMQSLTDYNMYGGDAAAGVMAELSSTVRRLAIAGIRDIILDPGFGFAKTLEQNYRLLARLSEIRRAFDNLPLLVGVSRKSMICNALDCTPAHALDGTVAVNMTALLQGVSVLRVHDVAPAVSAVKIYERLCQADTEFNTFNDFL